MVDHEIGVRLKWGILVSALKSGRTAKLDGHLDVLTATLDLIEAGHKDTGKVVIAFSKKDTMSPNAAPRLQDFHISYYTEKGMRL